MKILMIYYKNVNLHIHKLALKEKANKLKNSNNNIIDTTKNIIKEINGQ